jgi:hypothetical protein
MTWVWVCARAHLRRTVCACAPQATLTADDPWPTVVAALTLQDRSIPTALLYHGLQLSEVHGLVSYTIGAPHRDGHVECRPDAAAAAADAIAKVGTLRLTATFTEMRPGFVHVLPPHQHKLTAHVELTVTPGKPHELTSPHTQINVVANPGAPGQPHTHATTLSMMVRCLFLTFFFSKEALYFVTLVSDSDDIHRVPCSLDRL